MMGPWEGHTNITITGINLGKTFNDIYQGVTVVGLTCQPYEELYIRTKQIVCRVDGPGDNKVIIIIVGSFLITRDVID